VAFVAGRHGAAAATLQRQARLRAIERLDLAPLIHAPHQRVLRRPKAKPDQVDQLLDEPRLAAELKVSTRCGCNWCACQRRCTIALSMPRCLATDRALQCVAFFGVVSSVTRTIVSVQWRRLLALRTRLALLEDRRDVRAGNRFNTCETLH
jgi:hypothetical protein